MSRRAQLAKGRERASGADAKRPVLGAQASAADGDDEDDGDEDDGAGDDGAGDGGSGKVAKPRWRVWLTRLAAGGFAAALLSWGALNAVHQDAPRPLWGAVNLPPLPEGEDNGWQFLYDHPELFRGVDTEPADGAVRSALDAPVDAPWPTSTELMAVREVLAREPVAGGWAICSASLRAPAFVDACPLDFEQRCPAIDLLQCHRVGAATVLVAAAEGRWGDAAAEVDRLLDQSLALLGSARSVVVVVAAFLATEQALALADRLGRSVRTADRDATLGPLRATVASLDDADLRFDSAAIGEYLVAVHGLERMANGELDQGAVALPGFFFDTGATLAELNRIYSTVQRAPGRLAVPDLPAEPYTARFGWWLRNPLGKLYLDVVLPPRRAFEQLVPARERALRAREAAREALGPLPGADAAAAAESR